MEEEKQKLVKWSWRTAKAHPVTWIFFVITIIVLIAGISLLGGFHWKGKNSEFESKGIKGIKEAIQSTSGGLK